MRKLYPTYCRLIATLLLLGCSIALFAQGKTYYVKADSEITTSSNNGLSWDKAITLTEALRQARAGDEIWVKGYEDITGHIYKAPKGGFVLPSGVAMYGGFAGDETIKNDLPTGRHKYQMKYQTALVGDIATNDKASQQLIIYPENTTRNDNATHVLTLQMGVTQNNTNDGNKPTIVSGFLIAAGNAKGDNSTSDGRGGGIYVVNNSSDNNAQSRFFRISQCNFANNYGMRGGAIYVDNSCTNPLSAISYCSFFNNVAGKRGSSENEGGGMWIDGTATVYNCNINNNTNGGIRLSNTSKIVNCSVIANTVSAADLTTDGASNSNDGGAVYNTVLWHSTALSKQDSRPAFYSCAFPEVEVTDSKANTDANGNVRISNENHGIEPAPWFKQSAVTQGYDFSFSSNLKQLYSTAFTFEETSALLNKGKLEYYTNNVVKANLETTSTDIMGRTRYQNQDNTIDIGAYEYARMKAGRIRYVKPQKEGKGDGSSWDNATDDIQWAINDLAENASGEKGEVWVAAGTYVVKDRITDDTSSPVSLLMKNGISVYGAFKGTEKRRSERIEESKDLKPWGWKQESIIRGAEFKGSDDANWSNNDEAWNIQNSGSYHVVWFAPLPEGNAFTDEVYLEGFTIEGGKFQDTNKAEYAPDCGAGVYINDPSARMRYCTVRFCNPGMKESGNIKPRGGGIYCKNGQTEGNLVYNCSAYQGGGIYIDEAGFITRSMVTNCSAYQGAGVYLNGDAKNSEKAYYQILATSVISNNTSTRNGAVYLDGQGLVINNTIVNNYTNNTLDPADELSSNTGGVYIKEKGLLANNVIWNNSLLQHKSDTSNSASMAQIYAANPSEKTVQFYNNAISDVNAAKWTSTYQSGTISINTYYSGKGFVMGNEAPYNTVEAFNEKRGVLTDMKTVNYYWETLTGSRLRNVGISYALLPSSYLYQPKIDLSGKAISSVPSAGAYMADNHDLVFEKNDSKKRLRIYFDRSRELVDGTGESWEKSYTSSSVDEILGYLADIKDGGKVKVVTADNTTPEDFTIEKNSGWEFEICGREGIFEPKIAYTFEETDARSCTFSIPPCVLPITVYGGYPEYSENPNPKDEDRDPIKYRTELNGNLNGSELNEGLYHLVRIEAGANITIDGYAFTHAYAAGTAYMPYGGGVLIGSMDQSSQATTVKLKNCIFENNTATDGGAIATMPDAVNVKLELENCVINNNTSKDPHNPSPSELPSIIYLNKSPGSNNSLTLNHVSIINNEGVAPDYDLVKRTSYAVGNKLNINGTWNGSECKNSMDINTLGKDGALNFSNPTNEVGARMSGNVYYGGYSSFRPLTSSAEAGAIINSAQENNATTTAKDITGEDRNLGGVPDLGAYEALLPKAGKIIYVRSYNQDYESSSDANKDDKDGNPDFNLLNESDTKYDGSTWDKAIIGNAMCDNTKARTGNDFYVTDNGSLLNTTIENKEYSLANGKYRSEIDSYGDFWTNSDNQARAYSNNWGTYNKIANNRKEQYISGLQYAVERAAELNKNKDKKDWVVVWVGAGIYTDYKGFVIRDNVKVYGGFPYEGYPGEDDRHPLLSQYVPARKEYETLDKTKYETILQIRKESPVYFKNGDKEMWYQEYKPSDGSNYDFTKTLINSGKTERHYVLYQPDVCLPTWSPSGDGNTSRTDGNAVRYKEPLKDDKNYVDYEHAKWDGFSVRHGYIINYPGANRDGGAGVRVFRGVELENLIIVNNFNHGSRVRGGGLYMDGENSKISNSYLLRNLSYANSSESYGGGAYMIQGTGYNLVVANNRCYNGTCRGGGIFLESAKFYNNTIAYNMATNGTGIYHWQDAKTGVASQLSLYNCIIYDNYNNGKSITDQVNSAAKDKMNPSHNCYMNSSENSSDSNSKFKESDGNFTGADLAFPFEDKTYESGNNFRFRNARLKNNFRLNEADALAGNKCLNGGTTNVGNGIILPETDMDYTNRIKDCAIDIGAYEADNTTNIKPQKKTNSANIIDYIYYVTQNGWGNRSGDSPENAACADKLQDVLTAAGKKFETANQGITVNSQKHQVYVKVAGYQGDETGKRFTYHANTLADPSDPQSYTFLIPNGVCLMGGYYEGDQEGGKLKDGTANWDNDKRDCISTYQTVLSAKTEVKEGSAVNQEVNGYHTVCFGKWPTGDYDDYNTTALTENTIIDGCRLIDGNASDKSGFKSMGGAAIVPRMAHVRNCEISDCQATQGGALTLLKGSIVSGSVIVRNKAQKGGAIYALRSNDKNENIKNYHAYVISCTIARNEATTGGGIYQEENSLIGGNSVIWGNSAQTDNNISGDVNYQSYDFLQGLGEYTEKFYPYNYCFVEKMALPANRMNTEMTSDLDSYFNDNKIFKPRAYSPLIGNGVEEKYVNAWKDYGISSYDITGKQRTMTKQQTAGAYTSDLPAFDDSKLLKRLFVSQTGGEIVTEEEKAKYYGRSFLTPFNSLEAALDYINEAREKKVADDNTHFEILMTGGTYKPSKMRQNKDLSPEQNTIDRRLQSFTIPVNVDIFGSFSASDLYSSTPVDPKTGKETGDKFTSFGDKTLTPDGDIKDILANRNKNYMTDNNKNGLIEPWEFQNPTILSGDIKASEKERNVYHVVYSNAGSTNTSTTSNNEVVLDGITIMNGETTTKLKTEEGGTNEVAEIGRGGGIYTNRVNYTLNRCRLIKNSGLHGGAVYVNNASLDIIGSTISGNSNVSEKASLDEVTEPGKGGAIYLYLTKSVNGNLHIVNSLLANNDVTCGKYTGTESSQGGAIYIRRANDANTMAEGYQDAYIVNSLIVNNKAKQDGAIHVENEVTNGTITPILYNTAIWGNESTVTEGDKVLLKREHMRNCAWDELPASTAKDGNVKLNKENIASDGPRFTAPTTTKGYEGYTQDAKWNPQAISVLTDAGDGRKDANVANEAHEEGKYFDWWNKHKDRLEAYGYRSEYIRSANSSKEYSRYVGPKDEKGVVKEKPIDIGMYEFQYVFTFTDFEKVYIGMEEKGNGDGSSWDNQSTDLRGAIIAMANPSGNVSAGTTTNNNRKVFVRGGTYYSPTYSSGDAFSLIVNNDEKAKYITSIELVGGCTGSKNADGTEVQDFSKPSVLIENPAKAGETKNLLNIVTNGKPVTISGFTFQNLSGVGVNAMVNEVQTGTGKGMSLHHCAFRKNNGTAFYITNPNSLGVRMWSILFADGARDALYTTQPDGMHITNATFVNNGGTAVTGTNSVYNSVAWGNTVQNMETDENYHNVLIDKSNISNTDIMKGPNFVDPENGDYRIRPSLLLLNNGDIKKYKDEIEFTDEEWAVEKDLANTSRLIGDNIDIGAYECDTKMIPIIYVKEGSAVAGTGESWDNPTNDLQGAINLAELYANKNEGEYGYVFVDRNLKADNVNISMPGVKMFGSMREETSSATGTENIVKDLLSQRKGIIESSSQSTINGLTLNSGTTDTRMCIVDGFKVSGNVSLQGNSMLSTSILDANAKVSGDASGWLYNSLALGTVENVKSVNVTAEKALPETSGSAANRESVNTDNKESVNTYNNYVKDDYWKYQLDETSGDINANADATATNDCIKKVMHDHDLAGNKRIRDNVDNGCFETWYLTSDAEAKETDYPHGKSVVYVMTEDKELKLDNTFYTETNPFSPGFLLLKHHAGLRGNNSYVNLTNFAVERNLKKGTNFFSMPFKATNMEVEGTNNPADGSVTAYYYNAATRAKYDYKFDQSESKAWVKGVDNQRNFTAGFRMDAKADKMDATGKMTVRFYGTSYTEKDGRTNRSLLDKITLVQNNNQQPWSDSNGGGLKFTHKENMGWNLFGSPYLCAMNYSDMEYGRVIYQCEENGSYKAINTYDSDTGASTAGYIPAMDAVFTQTATLDNSESVIVGHSEARAATAYQTTRALDIAITQSNRNSRAGNSTPVDDQLQLNTVPAYEAKSDFDMGSDGVKWMTNQNAQIYAMRNGGRYSLLSAVSIEAEQSIGVSLPETGEYSISIPEDCDASEYETVWLKDKETGKAVDLKEGSYQFDATQAGEMNSRFSISFNRMTTDMKSVITVSTDGRGIIRVKGLKPADFIRVYGTTGVLAAQKEARAETETLRTAVNGTVVVEVTRGGKQVAVRKIAVR